MGCGLPGSHPHPHLPRPDANHSASAPGWAPPALQARSSLRCLTLPAASACRGHYSLEGTTLPAASAFRGHYSPCNQCWVPHLSSPRPALPLHSWPAVTCVRGVECPAPALILILRLPLPLQPPSSVHGRAAALAPCCIRNSVPTHDGHPRPRPLHPQQVVMAACARPTSPPDTSP